MIVARQEIRLEGCGPVPLGSYLKALGVFRLVAEQKDPAAAACWRDERLVLRTKLSQDELVAFFTDEYRPSPIVSPWNGRAGFLEGEEDESENVESKRRGAELIRAYECAADRFSSLRMASKAFKNLGVIDVLNRARSQAKALDKKIKKQPTTEQEKQVFSNLKKLITRSKQSVISELRSCAPEESLAWFDACLSIGEQASVALCAPLLGAGGGDGSRDFGMGFGLALGEAKRGLFDLLKGTPSETCEVDLRAAIFGDATPLLKKGNVGLFEPAAVGENQTSGFHGELPLNNWEFILLLEGAVLFAGSTTRRLGSTERTRSSFPFTVDALTAGTGASAPQDDTGFAEIWTPLWARYATAAELKSLLREGRSTVGRIGVKTGLDFAVSVASLGTQRGVTGFDRHAILVREPLSPRKATYLGRVETTENPIASLVHDVQPWLARLKAVAGGGEAGTAIIGRLRRADDALFRLTHDSHQADMRSSVEETLVAVGALSLECARRHGFRNRKEGPPPTPPPRLGPRWRELSNDGSAEHALASSLAGLIGRGSANSGDMPFRAHLAPLDVGATHDRWDESTAAQARVVWSGRDLVRDLIAVLTRRLVEAERADFIGPSKMTELPLRSSRAAPLWAVNEFLLDRTDNNRISRLIAGLAWADGRFEDHGDAASSAHQTMADHAPPFLYAVLKPLFNPAGMAPDGDPDPRRVKPLTILRLLLGGHVEAAAGRAQLMARGAGLSAPFMTHALSYRTNVSAHASQQRLAAALAFPITNWRQLTACAYPNLSRDQDPDHAT